jgi:hypothetical protein
MPPPIVWESCGEKPVPLGLTCKKMRIDWARPGGSGDPVGFFPRAVVSNAAVTIQFARFVGVDSKRYFLYRLVADVDGPILHAILETRSNDCTLDGDLTEGRYVYKVRENLKEAKRLVSGRLVDKRPRIIKEYESGNYGSVIGPLGVLEISDGFVFRLYEPPDFVTSTLLRPLGPDDGLDHSFPTASFDAYFWGAGRRYSDAARSKLLVYTKAGGTRDFIDNGLSVPAGSLGTDGVDLVWLEGYGRYPDGGFPPGSIMTAPYTTDPEKVAKRRLRSEWAATLGIENFTVGCGYAARFTAGFDGIRVVRLSDGHSWLLRGNESWKWRRAFALTCDELFADVFEQDANGHLAANIVRVRLDSLGPSEPPD